MQVDILGLENVLKYIEATKLTKFTIQRGGGSGQYIPVFECIESESNANAINEFSRWAEVANSFIPYKIVLYNFAEITTDSNGAPKVKKANQKSGKMESTFVLNNVAPQVNQANQQPTNINGGLDLATLRADIIKEISKNQEENAVLAEIKRLSARLDELDQEEDEEEEEEEESGGGLAGINGDQVQQILGLVNMFKKPATPPVINGDQETTNQSGEDQRAANINKAIKILYKHDKSLDTDLLKLADLAETKNETFKMLLTTLRSM